MPRAPTADRRDDGAVYESDDATVSVRPRRTDAGHQVLEYAVEATGESPVRCRLRQPIPDSVEVEDLGFPGSCGEDWEREDDALVFERVIDPAETASTAWGVDGEFGPGLEPPVVETDPVSNDAEPPAMTAEGDTTGAVDRGAPAGSSGDGGNAGTAGRGDTGSDDGAIDASADDAGDGGGASLELDLSEEDAGEGGLGAFVPAAADLDADEAEPADEAARDSTAGTTADDCEPTGPGGGRPPQVRESGSQSLEPAPDASEDGSKEIGTDAAPDGRSSPEADTGTDSEAVPGSDPGSDTAPPLVPRLVEELHGEDLDDRHRAALADALEVRLSDSTNAFVDHVREKQRRRTERLTEEIEALEGSVEGLYGVKADASEIDTLKRAITKLDDHKAGDAELRELRSGIGTVRDEQASLAASLTSADDRMTALEDAHESLATAAVSREEHDGLADELSETAVAVEALEERAATAERLDGLADDLAALREEAATAEALVTLEETVADLDEATATEGDLEDLQDELESAGATLDERIGLLEDRHEELAAESATTTALESLREDHRDRHNATISEVAALRETLEDEYSSDAEIEAELDSRLQRSVGTLACFGVGATGLVATVPLAIAGSPAAAVTFLGGVAAVGLWRRSLASGDGLVPGGGLPVVGNLFG